MATEKQIAANRANAQKGTGPRTEKGKATSSMNALKTGLDAKNEIIEACENRAERDQLTAAYYARYAPATEEESYLVDTAIAHEWLQRRYLSVEANIWKHQFETYKSLGGAFERASETFSRVDRRLNSALRNHGYAMKRLHALRAQRGADPLGDIPLAATGMPAEPPNPELPPPANQPTLPNPNPPSDEPGATEPLDAALVPETSGSVDQPSNLAPTSGTSPEKLESSGLNPELVSFRTFVDPAPPLPIAAPETPIPPPGPKTLTTDPAPSDII